MAGWNSCGSCGLAYRVVSSRRVRTVCFFFQAEDGIRYLTVTGVQTCALPIFLPAVPLAQEEALAPSLAPARLGQLEGQVTVGPRLNARKLRFTLYPDLSGVAPSPSEIGRAHVELQSQSNLVCRLLLEKKNTSN